MSDECVSVIIPVYNCEGLLEQCVQSVLDQTYLNLQVLLVDDGSTDRSGEICDALAERDLRVETFHIPNRGVSGARNFGLDHAIGQYIQFVDGDDQILPTMIERLVGHAQREQADLVVCGYDRITSYVVRKDHLPDPEGAYSAKEYLLRTLQDPKGFYYGVVWNKFFRRAIVEQHALRFHTDIMLGEDFVFTLEYLRHTGKVTVIHERLYLYNYRNANSLSRYKKTYAAMRREWENRVRIFAVYRECFDQFGLYAAYEKQIYRYWDEFYYRARLASFSGIAHFNSDEVRKWRTLVLEDANIQKFAQGVPEREVYKWGANAIREGCVHACKSVIKRMVDAVRRMGVKI